MYAVLAGGIFACWLYRMPYVCSKTWHMSLMRFVTAWHEIRRNRALVSLGLAFVACVSSYWNCYLSFLAYSRQTFLWTICRSVRPCVRVCISLSSALWKNGGSDPDPVWHHRSDGSMDEAGSGVWGSVHGKGYFWGRMWGTPL